MVDNYKNEILICKNKSERWIIKNYPSFYTLIDNGYSGKSWKEKLYCFINSLDSPKKCYCGNVTNFISITKGYRKYCSVYCQSNSSEVKSKRVSTNLNKWGSDNPMKNNEIKENYKRSIKEKWGVSNISKLDSVKNKVKRTNLSKYGHEYNSQRIDVKRTLRKLMSERTNTLNEIRNSNLKKYISEKISGLDISFIEILSQSYYKMSCNQHEFEIHKNTLNDRIKNNNTICTVCNPINNESDSENKLREFIENIYNGTIIKNNRERIGLELDIYLPDLNIAFEFNGIYWHSDKYKDKDYHKMKSDRCLSNGIQLIHIWEDDWQFKKEIVKSRIKYLLGYSDRIWARKCEIKSVSSKEVKNFLIDNHIQGYVGSKYSYGLYHNGILVSLMTFGNYRKSMGRISSENSYELLRFANKNGLSVIGGASKLFKFFVRTHNPKKIISYADRSWSSGNLYEKLGFKNEGYTNPNYYYVVNGCRKSRFSFRKDVLIKEGFDSSLTEFEIMDNRNILRIFDSGSIKFSLEFC